VVGGGLTPLLHSPLDADTWVDPEVVDGPGQGQGDDVLGQLFRTCWVRG
jgi:hypothetical protein